VKKSARYRELDYVFGQQMLTLRTTLGLTQGQLAERLGISMRTVSGWEAGSSYPKAEHLKAFIALCVRAAAFAAGRQEEQIRALWRAAHQKVLLDEAWLRTLLGTPLPTVAGVAAERVERTRDGELARAGAAPGQRVDWDDALEVSSFYNREREVATLSEWVVQERCRVASVLGLGGVGKSALAGRVMRQVAPHFEVVVFRSLRDAPPPEALLADCLQVLAPQPLADLPASLEARLGLLLHYLREERALLLLDNLESLLEEEEHAGHMRAGYEGYARLLRAVAETRHQSCLLLTSRERPGELVSLEGPRTQVRSLRLWGLEQEAGEQLLDAQGLLGSADERARLIERYGGNPLALRIVAQSIADLFGGEITPFLAQNTIAFGSIAGLLAEHFDRLSAIERTLLLWLAILREPVTIEELLALLATPLPRTQALEAVKALRRRSLIERGQRAGSFTLQSVVLEYATAALLTEMAGEIEGGRLARLIEYGLELAGVRDYVRQAQQRLLVAQLLAQLRRRYQAREELEQRLLALLSRLRGRADYAQGYGPANVLALLREQRGHLRDLDLSQLTIRGASLQGVQMQDTNLSGALLQECAWTQAFDAIIVTAISPDGQYWAAAGRRGEVRVWESGREGQQEAGPRLHRVWRAHTDSTHALAFSPDGHLLASGSLDGSLKVWDVESGGLLWSNWQPGPIICLAFSPDGSLLVSGGYDAMVRFWDPQSGTHLQEVPHPGAVSSLAWSPDGHMLATGAVTGTIHLWQMHKSGPVTSVQTLAGHTGWVRGLAFAPDGRSLASASFDGTVKFWELGEAGSLRQTLVGHTEKVHCVAWSADGGTLASGSYDHTIRLWDGKLGTARAVLQGHTDAVFGLAFTPDSRLLSGSHDGTLRLWDVQRGEALRVLQGYPASLYDVAWSPDGTWLASAGSDSVVGLWQVDVSGEGTPRGPLRGHNLSVYAVGWRPDGSVLASSGLDNTIRLWDPATGSSLQVISDRDHPNTSFWDLAWSPDGKRLASLAFRYGVLLWEVATGYHRWVRHAHPGWVRRIAWSPDGRRLVGGGGDGSVYVWDASDGRQLARLEGHQGGVMSVAWSPDGTRLASGGGGRGQGELFVWDAQTGALLSRLHEPGGVVYALAWNPDGAKLLSGDSDGLLCWWDLRHGERVQVRQAHLGTVQALKVNPDGRLLASCGNDGAIRLWDLDSGEPLGTLRRDRPYERLTITGIRGLTEAEVATLRTLGAVEDGLAAPG
jgi:WD40 repeat protein/transcriptional regulator with XRE-family HTH domain